MRCAKADAGANMSGEQAEGVKDAGRAAGAPRNGVTGTAIVAIGALIVLALLLVTQRNEMAHRLEEAERKAEAALSAVITPETLNEAARSVYLVLDQGAHAGTAFVVDQEEGILATAAHVVSKLEIDGDGGEIVNRDSKSPLPIRAVKIHIGYGRFRNLIEDYQPIDPTSPVEYPNALGIEDFPHDVALLYVDPIDPETGAFSLAPSLPIADDAALLKLKVGDPIASIGYPQDAVMTGTLAFSAASRAERGVIGALLSPIDQALSSDDPQANTLIAHRMAIAGGNSGGPILDRYGAVIGVTSHAVDTIESNGDAVAQRADALHDLLTPFREEIALAQIHLPDWRRRLAFWPPADEALPAIAAARGAVRTERKNLDGYTVSDAIEEFEELVGEDAEIQVNRGRFTGPRDSFVVRATDLAGGEDAEANSDEEDSTDAAGDSAGDSFSETDEIEAREDDTPVFVIDEEGFYASGEFDLDRRRNTYLFAFNYRLHPEAECATRLFHRWSGDDVLIGHPSDKFSGAFLPADPSRADDRQTVQVVVQGEECDYPNRFRVGFVSWNASTDLVDTALANAPNAAVYAAALGAGGFRAARARAANAIRCAFDRHEAGGCYLAIKAQTPSAVDGGGHH